MLVQRTLLATGILLVGVFGCRERSGPVQLDEPEMQAFVQLVLPERIHIQEHWTKPVSTLGNGDADALEVILSAYDALGDNTKVVGTLHFELYARRPASSEPLGERLAFWPVPLTTREALVQFWDPLSRFYKFTLQLEEAPLKEGRYILVARLLSPDGRRLTDRYEVAYTAGSAPPLSAALP